MGKHEAILVLALVFVLFAAKQFSKSLTELRGEPNEVRSFFRWLATILGLVIVFVLIYTFQHAR